MQKLTIESSNYCPLLRAWATLVKNPQNREPVIRQTLERLGGKLVSAWMAFGEYDSIAIAQMPDNVSAAAAAIAVAAGGALKAVKTTPLMSMEEGVEALRKAAGAGYRPPGS